MQNLFTLKKDKHVIRVNRHRYVVDLDRVIKPIGFGGGPKFKEIAEPKLKLKRPGLIDIQRRGDNLLIGGLELDFLLKEKYQLHPNIGVTLYYLQDEGMIPERYRLNEKGEPMEIVFEGCAFRSGPEDQAFWFTLEAQGLEFFGDFQSIVPNDLFEDWKNIAA
jgi:hypothetical protein